MKKVNSDSYYWLGYLDDYEVESFNYDEDTETLALYGYSGVIVYLSYADSPIQLETFTDEEINEHLLETYEEYVCGEDLAKEKANEKKQGLYETK